MSNFNKAEMLKDARKIARENGLTLKVNTSCTVNGNTVYKIVDRGTGLTVNNWEVLDLNCAYQTLLNNF